MNLYSFNFTIIIPQGNFPYTFGTQRCNWGVRSHSASRRQHVSFPTFHELTAFMFREMWDDAMVITPTASMETSRGRRRQAVP